MTALLERFMLGGMKAQRTVDEVLASHRRCTRCAKDFVGEGWRLACARCGGLVVGGEDPRYGAAPERALRDGWSAKSDVRDGSRGSRYQRRESLR